MLMIVCIPHYGIHSRAGQRLTGERMIRPAGELKSTAGILMVNVEIDVAPTIRDNCGVAGILERLA